jgi:hypothetical protein
LTPRTIRIEPRPITRGAYSARSRSDLAALVTTLGSKTRYGTQGSLARSPTFRASALPKHPTVGGAGQCGLTSCAAPLIYPPTSVHGPSCGDWVRSKFSNPEKLSCMGISKNRLTSAHAQTRNCPENSTSSLQYADYPGTQPRPQRPQRLCTRPAVLQVVRAAAWWCRGRCGRRGNALGGGNRSL